MPTYLLVHLSNCNIFHVLIIGFKSIQLAYIYIYMIIWIHTYTNTFTLSTCSLIHQTFLIRLRNWLKKTTSTMTRWHSLLETNPTCDTSGTCWARNDSLASPAKAASVASDQASCQRTILPDWRLMDDLMTDGEWYLRVGKDLVKIHGRFLILIRTITRTFRKAFIPCQQTQQKVSTFPAETCFASDPWSQFSLFVFVRNRFRPLILVAQKKVFLSCTMSVSPSNKRGDPSEQLSFMFANQPFGVDPILI